jgi:S-DNA-T family DNA segregation ATPase FtsK/SpoIIIE
LDAQRKNEILAILVLAVAFLFALSLFFSFKNQGEIVFEGSNFDWLAEQLLPVKETMGPVGYYIALILRLGFGYASFIIPLLFFLFSFYKFKGADKKLWIKISGLSLFTITLACLLVLFKAEESEWKKFVQGGYVGLWLLENLWWKLFGQIGTYIILLLLLSLSFLLSTEFLFSTSLANLQQRAGGKWWQVRKTLFPSLRRIWFQIRAKKEKKFTSPKIEPSPSPPPKVIINLPPEKKEEKEKKEKEEEEIAPLPSLSKKGGQYSPPPLSLLKEPVLEPGESEEELLANSKLLVETLKNFGIESRIEAVNRGPVVTRYELQLAPGIKVNKVVSLANDIALTFAAPHIRIEAPVPGKSVVGIEVPNKKKDTVFLKEILTTDSFQNNRSCLTVALGKDIGGSAIVIDLKKAPHLLIAGATGSGKSVCLNSIITSILFKSSPEEVKFVMIDPKRVELSMYDQIPHLLFSVVKESKKAAKILEFCVKEMEKRYRLLAEEGVRNVESYNKNVVKDKEKIHPPLPYIVIIIDELADLMMISPREVEERICRLAQMARGVGMHLVVATQRPSVNVITGLIKANIPSRISFAVSSQVDSRTILDMNGAETLLGAGDMLFSPVGAMKPIRAQGTFVSEEEVKKITQYLKQIGQPEFLWEEEEVTKTPTNEGKEKDILYDEAVRLVVENREASTTWLQRKLAIGYARAAKLIDEMEEEGIVGPAVGSKPRPVLVEKDKFFTEKGLTDQK